MNKKLNKYKQEFEQSKKIFINEFLQPEIKRISKSMGFKSYPRVSFDSNSGFQKELKNQIK